MSRTPVPFAPAPAAFASVASTITTFVFGAVIAYALWRALRYVLLTGRWDVVRSGIGPVGSVREVLSSAARWPRPGRQALQEVLPAASLVHFYGASELSFVSFDRGLGAADEHSAGELFDGVDVEIRDGLAFVHSADPGGFTVDD